MSTFFELFVVRIRDGVAFIEPSVVDDFVRYLAGLGIDYESAAPVGAGTVRAIALLDGGVVECDRSDGQDIEFERNWAWEVWMEEQLDAAADDPSKDPSDIDPDVFDWNAEGMTDELLGGVFVVGEELIELCVLDFANRLGVNSRFGLSANGEPNRVAQLRSSAQAGRTLLADANRQRQILEQFAPTCSWAELFAALSGP